MKAGRTLQELAQEVALQSEMRADFVVDSRQTTLIADIKGERAPELLLPNGVGEYSMSMRAQRQMAERLGYPFRLWERFRDFHPDLLMNDANALMTREPARRMIRCWDRDDGGVARAVLSDRYRRRDNDEILEHVVPILAAIPDARVESCQVTEDKLYLKVLTPRRSASIKNVGDEVCAGVVISNSEVGEGSTSVQPLVFRLICRNGMIAGEKTRYLHVGGRASNDEALRVYRDETVEADDKAFMMKLGDVVKAAVDETVFRGLVNQLKVAADMPPMPEPVEGMERLSTKLDLSEEEKRGALVHLIEGGDLSMYGAINALTRVSQDVESYDRATELEAMGGDLLAVEAPEWERLAGIR